MVLDCTDHPTSRYLISDACVLAGKPLVSASALKTEGQLIVLNNPPRPPGHVSGGPCYRCVFPKPPPADSVLSCGEGGILGPVVGVMGVLQALEAIKLLLSADPMPHKPEDEPRQSPKANMLIFSAFSQPQFRSVRMRGRRDTCTVCSSQASITSAHLTDGSMDYAVFCGLAQPANLLTDDSRIKATEFARQSHDSRGTVIDTRDETQYGLCALQGSINVPWTGNESTWIEKVLQIGALPLEPSNKDLYVICRNGNDSQHAVKSIQDHLAGLFAGKKESDNKSMDSHDGPIGTQVRVKDIKGGFRAWRQEVDRDWPEY